MTGKAGEAGTVPPTHLRFAATNTANHRSGVGVRSPASGIPEDDIVRSMRTSAALLTVLLALVSPVGAQGTRPAAHVGATTVTILHFNDVHEITPIEAGKAG